MTAEVKFKIDNRFVSKMKGRIDKYDFEVGIFDSTPRKQAKPKSKGFKNLAGGPARKTGKTTSNTNQSVAKRLRLKYKVNIFRKPFKNKNNSDLKRVINLMIKLFFSDGIGNASSEARLKNALQALVRNPILRGDYGNNSPKTVRNKGFNRFMIDTGQMFKSIKAKIFKK